MNMSQDTAYTQKQSPANARWGRRVSVGALALFAAAGMALAARPSASADSKSTSNNNTDAKQAASLAKGLSAAFRGAASTIGQSVVSIRTEKKSTTPAMYQGGQEGGNGNGQESQSLPPGAEKFFERFFGGQGGMPGGEEPSGRAPSPRKGAGQGARRAPVMMSQGSGVIATEDGNIVTNAHVIDGADRITVMLADGSEHEAKLLGADKDADLAVIKIEGEGFTAARFAESEEVQPGDWCVAVGNPFGLDHTVTAGIVSAKGRSGVGTAAFEDYIQTDTPINPGNSGGPLVNLDGEVIGINTAIRSNSGGNEGIGFAIPSATVQAVMHDLATKGFVERGYLGVSIQPLTPDLAANMGTKPKRGVLIGDVVPGGPGAKAGLEAGDIVTSVNGSPVTDPGQLMSRVARVSPGSNATLKVMRDGSERELTATLGKRPGGGNAPAESKSVAPAESNKFGLSVQPLDKALREQFKLKDDESGLAITDVAAGSAAETAGLQPGDVILAAGGKPATSAEQFTELAKGASADKGLLLRVKRGENSRFIVLKPE
ncbi:MAG: Do family serine endopeptidase [Planctomycetes bacterium]|nr:Do family serine endopeptidase [Planctomycetota bacterium]